MPDKKPTTEGMTLKKESNFIEWMNEVILKAELADYSSVSGCMVIRPNGYAIWEKIREFFDEKIKGIGVRNAYFPLLIPEKLLTKESEHIEGFAPEVAWVTEGGKSKLEEKLAIRPTSETIMYESYAKWIRSWRDLPLLINQWANVVRWEFKHPRLFLRTREFLWQEGHTVHADEQSATKEVYQILEFYRQVYEDLLAIPVTKGIKSEKEKFAGAVFTTTVEAMMPDGKVIQGGTSHYLGQHFSKPFGIKFLDKDETEKFAHQNSWGLSTRTIGVMIAIHSDNKGLVLPPRIAATQVVIVPIYAEDTKKKVLSEAEKIRKSLTSEGIRVELDNRDQYTPGWKFNEHELKGIPLRIEIGPKDIGKKQVIMARRDTGEKAAVKISVLVKEVPKMLETIQKALLEKAKNFEEDHTSSADNYQELKNGLKKGRVLSGWCSSQQCEDKLKEEKGAKISCMPLEQKKIPSKCAICGQKAQKLAFFANSY